MMVLSLHPTVWWCLLAHLLSVPLLCALVARVAEERAVRLTVWLWLQVCWVRRHPCPWVPWWTLTSSWGLSPCWCCTSMLRRRNRSVCVCVCVDAADHYWEEENCSVCVCFDCCTTLLRKRTGQCLCVCVDAAHHCWEERNWSVCVCVCVCTNAANHRWEEGASQCVCVCVRVLVYIHAEKKKTRQCVCDAAAYYCWKGASQYVCADVAHC